VGSADCRIYISDISRKNKIARLIWGLVWLILFRPTPRWFLNNWRVFLLKVFGAKIGRGCRVLPSCRIWAPWNLIVGNYSVLGDDVDCYSMDRIKIGSYVTVSQRAFLCCGSHDITEKSIPLITKPIVIGDFCWVCSGAFVGPGVTMGDYSIAAAHSVLTRSISDFDVVGGNPAVFLKKRNLSH
jgi:putative colanic acid biosynthesis acetyltransferase WcaF